MVLINRYVKLSELTEARYHGAVIVESWDDDGQTLYHMSPQDAQRLQELSEEPTEHEDTRGSHGGFTSQERRLFKEVNEIFKRAEKVVPDIIFDHYNFEFRDNR